MGPSAQRQRRLLRNRVPNIARQLGRTRVYFTGNETTPKKVPTRDILEIGLDSGLI